MRKSWWLWGAIVLIVTVFVVFNYKEGRDAVPLSEIFPEEEVYPVDVEYEFVQEDVAGKGAAAVETAVDTSRQEAVEKTAPDAVAAAISAPAPMPAYTIQIASFNDEKKAQTALTEIRKKVPSAYIATRDLGAKGVWYRVYAGRFNVRQEAEVSLADIKKSYDGSFIISPK